MVVTAMVVPEPRDQTIALVDAILVWTKRTTLRRVVLFDAKSQSPRTPNGRFLRHRPKRSERGLNYWRFYQRHPRVAKQERCAEGLSVKTMLGDPEAAWQARFLSKSDSNLLAVHIAFGDNDINGVADMEIGFTRVKVIDVEQCPSFTGM